MSVIQLSNIGYDAAKKSELDVIVTNLILNTKGKRAVSVLPTAWSGNVPKLTLQLAKSFALGKRKVLLINADDKNAEILDADQVCKEGTGLFDILAADGSLEAGVCATDVPGLYYLPCGAHTEHAVDLLGGVGFEKLLAAAKEQYDMVFVLSPSMEDSTEGITAARSADGCVVVTHADTSYGKIAKDIAMLKTGTALIGTILVKDKNPWMPSLPFGKGKK